VKEATAFAPCHITGVFQIFDQAADALHIGSKGAGVSLSLGVKTTVKIKESSSCRLEVSINHHVAKSARVSKYVADAFLSRSNETQKLELLVEHQVNVPIGAGFGTSGSSALSLAFALNKALGLRMSSTEASQLAHVAEVECKTGLGTVIAETCGGLEIRVKAGAPGIGEVKRLPVPEAALVACHVFGPFSTRKFLTDPETRARINRFGGDLVDELIEAPSIHNFMRLSREFAEHVGLMTKRVRAVLDAADKAGVVCSMPMFGESVFTITDEDNVDVILQVFREFGSNGQTFVSKIDKEGARLLQ
jgi:pantoate kinase